MVDKNLIDKKAEQAFEMVESVRADIIKIKGLAKISNPKKIMIFTAPKWKVEAIELLKRKKISQPDFGLIMKELMADKKIRELGKEVPAFAKQLAQKLPDFGNKQFFDEAAALKEFLPMLKKEFGAKAEAKIAQASDEQKYPKAKNALPLKPAIIIE